VLGTVVRWGVPKRPFSLETFGCKPFQWPVPSKERKNRPFFSLSKFPLKKSQKSSDWEGVNCQTLFQLGHISMFASLSVAKKEVTGKGFNRQNISQTSHISIIGSQFVAVHIAS
jgi:hypothetical protein